jgi:hypothetical protein
MIDEKVQLKANDLPEPEKPEQVVHRVREMQVKAAAQSIQSVAPGRKPLFRN